jgi:hypothetical protein
MPACPSAHTHCTRVPHAARRTIPLEGSTAPPPRTPATLTRPAAASAPAQFHAVALLHALRANDRLAISKLVSSLTKGSVRSPLAQCLLVRYVSQVVLDSTPGFNGEPRAFYDFLESCLRHKTEMVIFEAARAICSLKQVTARELAPAITVLQLFLSSSKPVLRFAAVRTLNKVAMTNPLAVTNCNIDMEALITDPNRSIATLAITTLLKVGCGGVWSVGCGGVWGLGGECGHNAITTLLKVGWQ